MVSIYELNNTDIGCMAPFEPSVAVEMRLASLACVECDLSARVLGVAGRWTATRTTRCSCVDKSVLHVRRRRRRRCALACGPVPTWTEGRVVARGEWSHLGRGA